MPYSISTTSIEHICSEIKKIEDNPQHEAPGKPINRLPAERAPQGGHFEGSTKKGD